MDTGLFAGVMTEAGSTIDQFAFDQMLPPTGWYHLYYNCECGEVWENEWDCACTDECPVCNKEIEPYKVEEVE